MNIKLLTMQMYLNIVASRFLLLVMIHEGLSAEETSAVYKPRLAVKPFASLSLRKGL
jgi:hypothetical protein